MLIQLAEAQDVSLESVSMACGSCKIWSKERSKIVDVLSALFGLGAWVGINGIYTQLPLLVASAPEGWQLPSIMVIVVQVSNIGVVAVWIIKSITGDPTAVNLYIYFIMSIGNAAMLILSFVYGSTVDLAGHDQSVPFIVLLFFISMGSCVSSVLYFPYMARFHEKYLVPYMVGEGLGGFIPSIISFGQGIGGNPGCVDGKAVYPHPHFGASAFMQILFGLMVASLVSFALLDNLGAILKGRNSDGVHEAVYQQSVRAGLHRRKSSLVNNRKNVLDHEEGRSHENPTMEVQETTLHNRNWTANVTEDDGSASTASYSLPVPGRTKLAFLLILQGVLCMLSHAVLPAVQSYSCLPYGNTIYHLSINLGNMANPLVCYLAFFLPHSSLKLIISLSLTCIVTSTYILFTAVMSPSPPLIASVAGGALVVICWVLNSASVSYAKLSIATIFRSRGGRGLFSYGIATQTGSAIGSLLIFTLVNFASIFHVYDPCAVG